MRRSPGAATTRAATAWTLGDAVIAGTARHAHSVFSRACVLLVEGELARSLPVQLRAGGLTLGIPVPCRVYLSL